MVTVWRGVPPPRRCCAPHLSCWRVPQTSSHSGDRTQRPPRRRPPAGIPSDRPPPHGPTRPPRAGPPSSDGCCSASASASRLGSAQPSSSSQWQSWRASRWLRRRAKVGAAAGKRRKRQNCQGETDHIHNQHTAARRACIAITKLTPRSRERQPPLRSTLPRSGKRLVTALESGALELGLGQTLSGAPRGALCSLERRRSRQRLVHSHSPSS